MKVSEIFEANFNDQMRGWENQNQYPASWDDEEFEPTENGFEAFEDVWEQLGKTARENSGAALVKIARESQTTPQKIFQELRKTQRYAVQEAGGNADELFYTEDDASRAYQALKSGNAKQFYSALYGLGENVLDYEAAEKIAQKNRDNDIDSPDDY